VRKKQGRNVIYRLNLSVLEEALLGFAQAFGLQVTRPESGHSEVNSKEEKP
jgi:hypothetical protein